MTTKHLRFAKIDLLAIVIIILSSLILMVDTLIFKEQPANMDGIVHVTNIASFYDGLKDGDFPVRWTDGFANYGLPMGSFAQQATSYLGAFFTFFTNNVIVSLNLVYILGTFLSVVLFYIFLRLYFKTWPSFVGAFLFNFAPYRIINLYIRGAVPEYFSSVFLASILIFSNLLFKKKTWWAYVGLSLSVFGIILSHPMNVLTGAFFIGPYVLYLLLQEKNKFKSLIVLASAFVFGAILSSYYLIPLLKDIQYFFYGIVANHYTPGSTLSLESFFDPKWYYFIAERNEILSRGHYIKSGLIETLIFISGIFFLIKNKVKKAKFGVLDISVLVGIVTLFLTTKLAEPIYLNINFLSNIQFPWRMLSTFIIIPPIIIAYIINKELKTKIGYILGFLLIIAVSWTRFPELYYKNLTNYPQDYYHFSVDNLHSQNMNTIWTESTKGYPVHKDQKVAVLEGEAELSNIIVKNSKRSYTISSNQKIRMINYTFYFPGWKVFSDGTEVPIEFQDVNNRGVITYWLPEGEHNVEVVFTKTKTVLLANIITIISSVFLITVIISQKKVSKLLKD